MPGGAQVRLVFDQDRVISGNNISFSSRNVLLGRSSGKMHTFMQNFLTAYPPILLGHSTPSLVMQELAIQCYEGERRTSVVGSVDIAYFGLNGTMIEWGVFVEVKSSFSLEEKLSRFRRKKKRPPLPMSGTFKQISRHMNYISLIPGFDFSPNSKFSYLLVFPKSPPHRLVKKLSPLTSNDATFAPLSIKKALRLRDDVDGMIRVVEVYPKKVVFRDSLKSPRKTDLALNVDVMGLHGSKRPVLKRVQ